MTTPTLRTVLDQLYDEHLLDETALATAHDLLQKPAHASSWMIQGLMVCGAWIAAVFLMLSVGSFFTVLLNSEQLVSAFIIMLMGGGLMAGTARLRRTSNQLALVQFMLVYQLVGQVWFVVGVAKAILLINETAPDRVIIGILASVVIALQIIMIPLYADRIYRFLAGLAIVGALFALLVALDIPYIVSVGVAVLAVATAIIWSGAFSPSVVITLRPLIRPVSYALVVGMLGALVFESMLGTSLWGTPDLENPLTFPIVTAVALTLSTVWLVARWLGEYQRSLLSPLGLSILALLGLLTVPSVLTPGIMAGVLLILLGFRNRNRVLSSLAVAFLAGFVIYFYYDLQTTLLVKSLILMVSGLLLLVSRLLIPTFVKEETA